MIDNLTLMAVDPWWITAIRISAAMVIILAFGLIVRRVILRRRWLD